MDTKKGTYQLEQFRQQAYQNFNNRADTLMDLVDALSSNTSASSVVELSLNPVFRRSYTALYKSVAIAEPGEEDLARLVAAHLPRPSRFPFWLFGVDVTSQPRPFSRTLADRSMVYQPNPIKGNKPVTVGHQYSTVALLPEKGATIVPWVVPLATRRVQTLEDKEQVGAEQLDQLLSDPDLPFHDPLCVEVGDTAYSKPAYLHANRHHPNLVTIARVRSNRTFYRQPPAVVKQKGSGHPRWYGERFSLKEPATWHTPDEAITTIRTSRRGRHYQVEIQAWHQMRMSGKQKPACLPMHRYPFTLIRICWYDAEGRPVHRRPLWLIVVGQRRHEVKLLHGCEAYEHRSHMEHFFRFGKQRLLLTRFQTPEVAREESWWQLVHLAYAQLWVARPLVQHLPRPWECYLPSAKEQVVTPTRAQRDFGRIIRQLGTPARLPKPRGYSPGRRQGSQLRPRIRSPVYVST
ncbi:MAG: transposase [Gammaproteobacteria bacterium]|nr:transposase [Gammaproteobacteria bacterium]